MTIQIYCRDIRSKINSFLCKIGACLATISLDFRFINPNSTQGFSCNALLATEKPPRFEFPKKEKNLNTSSLVIETEEKHESFLYKKNHSVFRLAHGQKFQI